MTKAQLRTLRDRLYLTDDIPEDGARGRPALHPPGRGLRRHGVPAGPWARASPGRCPSGSCGPRRALRPDAKVFEEFAAGSGTQSVSTTMVFARLLRNLVRDPTVGSLVAPIVSDEARTFGLEPIIAEAKIYAPDGQNYVPVDADLPLQLRRELVGPGAPGGHHRGGGAGQRSSRWPRPTPRGVSPWCRCTSSIRCSASSGSATWPGRSATCAAAASWPAAPPAAPPSWVRGCSTTTASRRCWPRPTRPPWSTTPRSPTRWR